MELEKEKIKKLQIKSNDNSFHSFGKAYLFEKRARHYERLISLLTVLGIIVPVSIGATVLGYGINNDFLKIIITFAIPVSIFQLLISIISVVYKWSDELSYANESAQEHYFLSDRFKKLSEFPADSFIENDHQFEIINTRLKSRIEQDSKHNIKDWELRMGMKYALREYQKECTGCNIIPISMEYTDCPVCGKFKNKLINRL
jgi:mobilome CxxCx(11)CxxC protein